MARQLPFILLSLLAAGCALNRQPIRQSGPAFTAGDPAAQSEAIRGVVHRGFTIDMVERALGDPLQIRATPKGTALTTTWIYPNSGGGNMHIVFEQGRVVDILHVK